MGGGDAAFEWVGVERHHHLICRKCNGVTLLDHHYLERLGAQIATDLGFRRRHRPLRHLRSLRRLPARDLPATNVADISQQRNCRWTSRYCLPLGIGGAVGVLGAALALGIRHGIDWDHIAAITDITSTAASADDDRRRVARARARRHAHRRVAPRLRSRAAQSAPASAAAMAAMTAESHVHSLGELGHRAQRPPNGTCQRSASFVRRQRPALLLGTMYALGHGSIVVVARPARAARAPVPARLDRPDHGAHRRRDADLPGGVPVLLDLPVLPRRRGVPPAQPLDARLRRRPQRLRPRALEGLRPPARARARGAAVRREDRVRASA